MTDKHKKDLPYSQETSLIIKSFYSVYNQLGFGFSSDIYKNSLQQELLKNNLLIEIDKSISIYYNSVNVGDFTADIIISKEIIVTIKSSEKLQYSDEQILYNSVRNSSLEIGLLFNFGTSPEFCRKSFNNTIVEV